MPSSVKRGAKKRAQTECPLDELNDQLDAYSGLISGQLRTVNIGVLGLAWLLLLKQDDVATLAIKIPETGLLLVAVGCIVALVVDLLQYLFAERTVEDTFDRAEQSETKTAAFDADSLAYRAQLFCYRLKLAVTFGSAFGLLAQLLFALFP